MNMDAKGILGLPKTPFSVTQEKKSRPQKDFPEKTPWNFSQGLNALVLLVSA
ncbi:hypothetical protein SLEP1_g1516 [Rubroshorea leprosula]|uniref:Uncharacterized protein n=1 Tax=Rubroshorea leprosula TaxID=152421 RepID=A0AAV5HNL5_9ROSI|nr:hypothetical protein SLEP1_g1516 [Rubroshorea leprosula]